jgi:hypothetical protein
MDGKQTGRWTLFERAFLILPTILVASVVWFVASGTEREKVRLEYVRLASGILRQPAGKADAQRGMREWAVAVLNNSAPVKLSRQQADALIDGTATLPRSGYFDSFGDDYGGYEGGPTPEQALQELLHYRSQKNQSSSPSPTIPK